MVFDNVKAICEERNLPISKLEQMAGLGNGTISGWKESSPRLDSITAVANALNIPLSALIGSEQDKEES